VGWFGSLLFGSCGILGWGLRAADGRWLMVDGRWLLVALVQNILHQIDFMGLFLFVGFSLHISFR